MGRERSAQLVSTVADSKTPLSKEVRSTSKMVNGRPGVGQAFHDLGSRSHEKIMFSPFSPFRYDIQRQTRRNKNVRCVDLEIYISEKYREYI